jgi:hypothetical protein
MPKVYAAARACRKIHHFFRNYAAFVHAPFQGASDGTDKLSNLELLCNEDGAQKSSKKVE